MPDPVEQPEGQDPVPAAAPPVADGPWSQDLQQFDEAVRPQIDEYLRTKIQPRMTQLEQTAANARDAQQLYDAFVNDPDATTAAVLSDLYGPEAAQQWQQYNANPEPQEAAPVADPVNDPRIEQMWRDHEQTQALQVYESEMNRIVEANPGIEPEFLHPFVVTADGNFDQAVELYTDYVNRVQAWNERQNPSEPEPDPVPVLGAGQTAVPTQPNEVPKLGDAIKGWFDRQSAGDPPPVQ